MNKERKNRSVPKVQSVFTYISACCSEQAEKPPCAVQRGQNIGTYVGAKPAGEATLGSWRCSKCRKPCKVSRVNPKPEVANV